MWCRYLPQIGILYHENLHFVTFYKSSRLNTKLHISTRLYIGFKLLFFHTRKKLRKLKNGNARREKKEKNDKKRGVEI